MAWYKPLEFYERFTVTNCQNPDYCNHCNNLIKRGQIKVAYRGLIYHKDCIEESTGGQVRVNVDTMHVEPNESNS